MKYCLICSKQFDNGKQLSNHNRLHNFPEWIERIRDVGKANKGKRHPKLSEYNRLNSGKPRKWMNGEKHWNWKGGITKERQRLCKLPKYIKWRHNVFERDLYTCRWCGKHGVYLEAHHIKEWKPYPESRYVVSNGLTLCKKCHDKTKKGVNT